MIQPLSKEIYEKALELNVEEIDLKFTGGSDEGYCYVDVVTKDRIRKNNVSEISEFEQEIEEWVWKTFDYSGAGDGNDYGDNITYDLVNNTVSHEEWYMERHYEEEISQDLKINKSND